MSIKNACERATHTIILSVYLLCALILLVYYGPIVLRLINMYITLLIIPYQYSYLLVQKIWTISMPYIFIGKCWWNTQLGWDHCVALTKYIPVNFAAGCGNAGVDYQVCVDLLYQAPYAFLAYFQNQELAQDPLEVLRLYPF